jgi:hypothetical protein
MATTTSHARVLSSTLSSDNRTVLVVQSLRLLADHFERISMLSSKDSRLVVLDAIINGADEGMTSFDANEFATLDWVGVPRELYAGCKARGVNADRTIPSR